MVRCHFMHHRDLIDTHRTSHITYTNIYKYLFVTTNML